VKGSLSFKNPDTFRPLLHLALCPTAFLGNAVQLKAVLLPPLQVCLAASRPKLVEIIADPPADVDLNTVKHIARVRHVTPEGTSKSSQH
jgi:hypothetical protein